MKTVINLYKKKNKNRNLEVSAFFAVVINVTFVIQGNKTKKKRFLRTKNY